MNTVIEHPTSEDIDLDKESFLIDLVRGLSGTLQDLIGLEEASGMISVVGAKIGADLNQQYRQKFQTNELSVEQICHALVDLKKRIDGGFSIEEVTGDEIVLVNNRCPFGKAVLGRKSMCMMTSNVFGKITAENLGYARVELKETIAQGDPGCRVVIKLGPSDTLDEIDGREYFRENE